MRKQSHRHSFGFRFMTTLFVVILFYSSMPALDSFSSYLLQRIKIKVLDESKQPLVGVSVYTDDMGFADYTDVDGIVTVVNLDYNVELNFTYIGYKPIKLPLYEIRKLGAVIRMEQDINELQEIVVIGRRDDTKEDIPYYFEKITQKEISLYNSKTSADVLNDNGSVFVQKSQFGGGSPVIRGFEANKVLLVLDGVRLNNAIYRSGHLQNSISVDNSILERVEVIFGPGSLMYGSDALGGVIHFRSKEPKLFFDNKKDFDNNWETNSYMRFATTDFEKTFHSDIMYGSKKWGSLTSITLTDHDDLRSGGNRSESHPDFGKRIYYVQRGQTGDQVLLNPDYNIQRGTGYSQIDFLQKIKYQSNEDIYYVGNFQYSSTSNIPRYDKLTDTIQEVRDLKYAEWYYGPQKRLLLSLKTRVQKPTQLYEKATFIASFQKIDEDRLYRKLFKTKRKFQLEDVFVYAFTADFDKTFAGNMKHSLAYGLDFNFNTVASRAGKVNLTNEELSFKTLSRYPANGSKMTSLASYVNYRWKTQDSTLTANIGLRYSYVKLFSMFRAEDEIGWPPEFIDPGISATNGNLTWGIGLTYFKNGWQINALTATAFRSPNIDDFSKIREKNGFVTIPNIDLKPENAITGELTIGKKFKFSHGENPTFLKVSTTGFYTRLTNAIVRFAPFPLPVTGDTILVMDDDTLITQANINADKAFVTGVSGNIEFNIKNKLKFKAGINYTIGRSLLLAGDTIPLSHIPPIYGKTSLGYFSEKFTVDFVVRYNGEKKWEDYAPPGSSDNRDEAYAVLDDKGNPVLDGEGNILVFTPAWTTYSIYSTVKLSEHIFFDFAVENIFDLHYRPFSSGVSSSGRNFIFTLRGKF